MLVGGPLEYTLRRSPRSRGLRVVIHPDRGVVVTVPAAGRRGWADPERHVTSFLAEREPWLRRHLARQARDRAELEARGGLRDGAIIRFRGDLHRLRLVAARTGARRSRVERIGGTDEDEIVVHVAPADRRPMAAVLEAWLKPRARAAIERDIARHAGPLGVSARGGQHPRPADALGERVARGPAGVLVAAHPRPTRGARDGRRPRAGPPAGVRPRAALLGLVATRRPDHRVWRRWLREHSAELHGALADAAGAAAAGWGGGDEGTRTPDPRDANAVLFQLSYIPTGGRPSSVDGRPVRNGSTRALRARPS